MRHLLTTAVALSVALACSGVASAAEVYAPPAPTKLKAKTLKWVATQKVNAAVQKQVEAIWKNVDDNMSSRAAFQMVIDTFAVVRADARKLIASCKLVDAPLLAPQATIFQKKEYKDFFAANIGLYYGRYLAQRKMYEEGHNVLSRLDPKAVADPATCLFYRAVCEHQLLQKKEGLATLEKLLKSTQRVPVSYTNVATLMQDELQGLKNGVSLKKVSLKMRNSDRHLKLARAGQNIQKLQGEIIADLDAIIEKLEQQGGS